MFESYFSKFHSGQLVWISAFSRCNNIAESTAYSICEEKVRAGKLRKVYICNCPKCHLYKENPHFKNKEEILHTNQKCSCGTDYEPLEVYELV